MADPDLADLDPVDLDLVDLDPAVEVEEEVVVVEASKNTTKAALNPATLSCACGAHTQHTQGPPLLVILSHDPPAQKWPGSREP